MLDVARVERASQVVEANCRFYGAVVREVVAAISAFSGRTVVVSPTRDRGQFEGDPLVSQ